LFAQNEMEKELSSLTGINSLYTVVNIEGSQAIVDSKEVNVKRIQESIRETLREAGLNVISNKESIKKRNYPYLYVHINAMETEVGYIPFAINIDFFQPVKLVLSGNKQMMASTWETGSVAMVSPDRMEFLEQSALAMVEGFIQDFNGVNQSR